MAIKRQLIQFTIVNDSDCNYIVPFFQQNVYTINATTKYSWDITSENLSCGTASILINGVVYNVIFDGTLFGLITQLNGLKFGLFCSQVIGGNTYLFTVDDVNIYDSLSLCAVITTTTTTTTTTPTPTTTTTTTTTTPTPTTTTTTTTTTPTPTTSTTTTTTTPTPSYFIYDVNNTSYATSGAACASADGNLTLYGAESTVPTLTTLYTDTALTTPYSGTGDYYRMQKQGLTGSFAAQITAGGAVQNVVSCP